MHSDLFTKLLGKLPPEKANIALLPLSAAVFLVVAMIFSIVAQWPRNEDGRDLLSKLFNKSSAKGLSIELMNMTTPDLIKDWLESHELLIKIFKFKNRMFQFSAVFFFWGCLLNFSFYAYQSSVWDAVRAFSHMFPGQVG